MIGQTISRYHILEQLGAGGMGVVYKAEDLKLGRLVALKFLPAHLLDSPEHKARFLQEARAAALLDHPNICTVFEIDEAGGHTFLALAYLEGQTLKDKIAARPLPLIEALEIAAQIGQGLQAAHEKGIVHRDIKPANVMITPQGQVKIMDFGLARLSDRTRLTVAETRLGTPAYMSPEQTEGKSADRRSDIWSLGVVLYEMLSGAAPFRGETEAAVAYGIVHSEPEPLTAVRTGIPIELDHILAKALAKDAAERYQHVDDLLADLRAVRRRLEGGAAGPVQRAAGNRKRLGVAMAVAGGLAVVAAGVMAYYWPREARVDPAQWTQITHFPDSATSPALSADGRMLTFLRGASSFYGPAEIFVKMLPDGEPAQLTRDGSRKMSPLFSPDGSRIAYTVVDPSFSWDTWVVPVIGGEPQRWLPNASGLIWWDRQRLLFSEIRVGDHMVLVTARENRAEARDLYVPPSERGMAHRSWASPDRNWVLLAEMERSRWLPCRVVPADGSSSGRSVGPEGQCTHGAWSPDGEWIYFCTNLGSGFHIWRQRFPEGEPEQLTFGPTEEEGLAVAPDGRSLLTAAGTRQSSVWLRDSNGDRELSSEGFAFLPAFPRVRPFSADGKRLYFLNRQRPANYHAQGADVAGELWVAELDSGRIERWITGFEITGYDISADQKSIVFAVLPEDGQSQIWTAPLDRRSPPRQLTSQRGSNPHWAPDGTIFFDGREGDSTFVYQIRADGTGLRKAVDDAVLSSRTISPDAQYLIALVNAPSEESNRQVVAFPLSGGSRIPLCTNCYVNWTADQKALQLMFLGVTRSGMGGTRTVVLSLPEGKLFPPLPPEGIRSPADIDSLPGVRFSEAGTFYPSADLAVYAYTRETVQRNIYRIPIP